MEAQQTLKRQRYVYKAVTHNSAVARLFFEIGPALSIWRHDPALADLKRGDHIVFGNRETRQITRSITESVYTILHINPDAN